MRDIINKSEGGMPYPKTGTAHHRDIRDKDRAIKGLVAICNRTFLQTFDFTLLSTVP